MKILEKEGRTVDEAVDAAAEELGVPKTRLAIEILNVGTAGFFGMLARKAKVRVTLKESENTGQQPLSGRDKDHAADEGSHSENKSGIEPFFRYEGTPWFRSKAQPKPAAEPEQGRHRPQGRPAERRERSDRPRGRGGRRDDRRPRQHDRAERSGQDRGRDDRNRRREPERRPAEVEPDVALQMPPMYHIENRPIEPAAVLEYIARSIVPSAKVEAKEVDDQLWLDISANGRGIFIGRKGATLDAIQFIVNKIVRKAGGYPKRIVVDSEGYRKRRNDQLASEASKLADRVRRGRSLVETEPLSAFDRRIVHLSLKDDPEVTTRSIGAGEIKRIQVLLRTDPAAMDLRTNEIEEEDEEEDAARPAPKPEAQAPEPEKEPVEDGHEPDGEGL